MIAQVAPVNNEKKYFYAGIILWGAVLLNSILSTPPTSQADKHACNPAVITSVDINNKATLKEQCCSSSNISIGCVRN